MGARTYGGDNLAEVGREEDVVHFRARFFEVLEEAVVGFGADFFGLFDDDEKLVSVADIDQRKNILNLTLFDCGGAFAGSGIAVEAFYANTFWKNVGKKLCIRQFEDAKTGFLGNSSDIGDVIEPHCGNFLGARP